jgi:hypothetical protein
VITLSKWRKAWRLNGKVVPASEKDPEGWGATVKFTVVLETAGLMPLISAPTAGSGACPGAGGTLAAIIPGFQRKDSAQLERAERPLKAPRPRPAGNQVPLAEGVSAGVAGVPGAAG